MGMGSFMILSLLFVLVNIPFTTSQIILKNSGSLTNELRSVNLTSNNRVWTFHRNNQEFHLTGANYASDDHRARGRFNFVPIQNNFKIQNDENSLYFRINENGQLVSGVSETQASTFEARLANVENSTVFNLFVNNNDPLVTVQSRPPFYFYTQSKYPLEPPAEFTLTPYKVDIEESYGGNRNNIIPTALLIRKLQQGEDLDASYAELLDSMNTRGHFVGKEILVFGKIIFNDTDAESSSAFSKLPFLVQNVCSGIPMKLTYFQRETAQNLSLIGHEAPKNKGNATIEPYIFTLLGNMTHPVWAITYATNIQLYHGNGYIASYRNSDKRFEFQLHLQTGFNQIQMYSTYRDSTLLYASDSGGLRDHYLFVTSSVQTAKFFVEPYTFEDKYEGNRSRIVAAAEFIQRTSGLNKARDYERLIRLMEINGHFEGQEVFEVAQYVKEDFGYENVPIFNLFPLPVQLVTSDTGVHWNYYKSNTLFPFKYSWASDLHSNILPYTFHYGKSQGRFSITYGGLYQLKTSGTDGDLIDENSPTKVYSFTLHLEDDLTNFKITCYSTTTIRRLWTPNAQPDFYFKCSNVGASSIFSVDQFVYN